MNVRKLKWVPSAGRGTIRGLKPRYIIRDMLDPHTHSALLNGACERDQSNSFAYSSHQKKKSGGLPTKIGGTSIRIFVEVTTLTPRPAKPASFAIFIKAYNIICSDGGLFPNWLICTQLWL